MKQTAQFVFLSFFMLVFCQAETVFGQDSRGVVLKNENKILLKDFGFVLPNTAEITNKLITSKTKVTFLFVTIPVEEFAKFKSSVFLQATNTEGRVVHPGDRIGWLPGYNLEDEPEDFIDNWVKSNQLNLGVFARILILGKSKNSGKGNLTQEVGKSKYAVLVADSEKGFLTIRYKR